jgi:type II secretory pathway component GspD/PulD (secretin)
VAMQSTGIRSGRGMWTIVALGVVWLAAGSLAWGQPSATQPAKAREAFAKAREAFSQGEHEPAAFFYQQAKSLQAQLTPVEQKDLDEQIRQNNLALKEQRIGRAQLFQAQEAQEKGDSQKADTLLRMAAANQYLTQKDRANLNQLMQRAAGGAAGPGPNPAPSLNPGPATEVAVPKTWSYDKLLKEARAAQSHGDLETAELLAMEAKKAHQSGIVPNWMQPWSDSPDKILREVQTARQKAAPQPQTTQSPQQSSGIAPFKAVRNLFGMSNSQPQPGPNGTAKPAGLVRTGFQEGSDLGQPGDAPDDRKEKARQLIKQGYQAMSKGEFEQARQLAEQAQQLRPGLAFWEDNPEKLLADIDKHAPFQLGSKTPPASVQPKSGTDARLLVKQGRELLDGGDLEGAEKFCNQADADKSVSWGIFEDSPAKLRSAIQTSRTLRDREEAKALLVNARKLFDAGDLETAKEMAWKAKRKFGEPGILDQLGDRPDALLQEIHQAELAKRSNPIPPPPGVKDPLPPPINLQPGPIVNNAPSPEQTLARSKVVSLLEEARNFQKQGRLIEARTRALEARDAAVDARKLGVQFGPNEDSPDTALFQMNLQCRQYLEQFDRTATELVNNQVNDPARFQKALEELKIAQQLAGAFNFDQQPIGQKMLWVQQMEAASQGKVPQPPTNPANVAQNPQQQQGMGLLEGARQYLRQGQTTLARKMAEEALDPQYGVQQEAQALLNSIDTEESNQRVLTAIQNFEGLRDAHIRKDYHKARIFAKQIEVSLLPEAIKKRYQEIVIMPEMQPDAVVQNPPNFGQPKSGLPTGLGNPPGLATSGDSNPLTLNAKPNVPGNPSLMNDFQAKEDLVFQKLRHEGNNVLNQARDVFKAGDRDRALDMLREYNNRVASTELTAQMAASLQKPVQYRMEQYRIMKQQIDWWEAERDKLKNNAFTREEGRNLEIEKRNEKISELMAQARNHYRDREFMKAQLIAKQIKALDPDNVAANNLIEMTSMAHNLDQFNKTEDQKADFRLKVLDISPGEFHDVGNPIGFDTKTWEQASKRKPSHGYSTPKHDAAEREIELKLLAPISFNFMDTPLRDVLDNLQYLSEVPIIPDTKALQDSGISLEQRLSLKVENMALRSALYHLLKKVDLQYVIKEQALQITTKNNMGNLVTVTYPVADLVVPVQDSVQPGMASLDQLMSRHRGMNGVYGGPRPFTPLGGTLPFGQPTGGTSLNHGSSGFASSGQSNPGQSGSQSNGWQVGGPKVTIEERLIKLVTATVHPESWAEVGGKGTIQYYPLGLGLVVNQTQDIQEQVFDLLQALRRLQELEVAIEIRLISVSESFFEFIGVDFDINIQTPVSRFEPQIVSQQFAPPGFVNRPRFDGFVSGLTPAGTFTNDLNIPINSSSLGYTIPQLGGFPGALGADGGLSLGLAFLSDIQVFMFIEAAQGDRRANTMQAPRVTVFNGQQAALSVNDVVPFLIDIAPTFAGDQLYFVPTQIGLPLGTQIFVTPVVSADRRFVRLSLTQTMTNLVSSNVPLIPIQIPIFPSFNDGNAQAQPQIFQIMLQQPSTANIFVQTTVTVPDGGTVLLGGLKALTEARSEFGPPILSKIPYINRLFKNVGYGREASSLMMMVTPRIIINEEEELIYLEKLEPIPRGNF